MTSNMLCLLLLLLREANGVADSLSKHAQHKLGSMAVAGNAQPIQMNEKE